jgi:predicted RNase H-like HicB family nuclease
MKYTYGKSVAGGYWGFMNDVPGAISQGKTVKELRKNLKSAKKALLKTEMISNNRNITRNWSTFTNNIIRRDDTVFCAEDVS